VLCSSCAAAPRRFTTGLIYNEKFLKASRNSTRRDYRKGRTRADLVKSLGAKGPNAVSVTDLALAACDSSSIGPECVDVLLLALTPAKYSSNDTTDTPGGNALISPAQVSCKFDLCALLQCICMCALRQCLHGLLRCSSRHQAAAYTTWQLTPVLRQPLLR
jgi:hypothetical protein